MYLENVRQFEIKELFGKGYLAASQNTLFAVLYFVAHVCT